MKCPDSFAAFGLFTASFVLYIRTLAPSLLYGDSAEFQTISYTLGIGHPTGYPVYILLAKLFTFFPVGEVAWRVNLFSAFCAALTVVLAYLLARKLNAGIAPALFGSIALAITPLFWKHASLAEIYTLSAACLAFILFATLQWKETKNARWLFIAGLFGGLSLGIHTTVALAAPAVLMYVLISPLRVGEGLGVRIKSASLGAAIGVVIFLSSFIFLDFINSPAGYYNTVVRPSLSVWDMSASDFDSPFERLAFLYFPPQFKGQLFDVPADESLKRLGEFVDAASWSLWLAFPGIISLFVPRKGTTTHWHEALLLVLTLATLLLFAATYNVYDYYVYFIPAILILVVLAGLGVQALVDVIALIPKLPRFVPQAVSVVLLLVLIAPKTEGLLKIWRERIPPGVEDWEAYFYEYPDARRLEAESIVERLEDNAIVFTDWDRAYGFYYAAHVMQGREGLSFHETYPQEGVYQLADSAVAYIEANIDTRPIYFSERPSQLANKFKITRTGTGLFRIERK